jgi:hypothetical protein
MRSLSNSRHYISKYALTWCNHGHIIFVLVSFLAKESSNLALMATLAKPPLGVVLMTPKLFAIQPMSLIVSFFCEVTLFCYTMKVQKVLKGAKNSLDVLSTSFWLISSSRILGILSTSEHSKAHLPPLSLMS